MGVSLTKGGNVSLTKEAGGSLESVTVGLGWDVRTTDGAAFDLDAAAFALNSTDKVESDSHFIYFKNLVGVDGAIKHAGDNLTGEGDGDDEQIKINLAGLPDSTQKVALTVNIFEAETRQQNFGMVSNAFIRVVNDADGKELAKFDLSEDYSMETALVFGEVYKHGDEWKFKAVGQGYQGNLKALCENYGVSV